MTDLVALLKGLTRPGAGREVDIPPDPTSTRGTWESNGTSGQRQIRAWTEAHEDGRTCRVAVGFGLGHIAYRGRDYHRTGCPTVIVCHPSALDDGAWNVIARSHIGRSQMLLEEGEEDLVRACGADGAWQPLIQRLLKRRKRAAEPPKPKVERPKAPVVRLRQPPSPAPEPWREKTDGQLVLAIEVPRVVKPRAPRGPVGRPSKITPAEVDEVYGVYQDGHSLGEIIEDRWEDWGYRNQDAALQSLKRAFDVRGYRLRTRSEAQALRFARERRAA